MMRAYMAIGVVVAGCVVQTPDPVQPKTGSGLTGTGDSVALDTSKVPVLAGPCAEGQVVARAADGWKCVSADSGPKGDTGATGPQGIPGEHGDSGPSGSQGDTGLQGPPGDTGPSGSRGDTGPQGPAGASVDGESVDVGDSRCPQGGAKFYVGSQTLYACNGEPGSTGADGLQGTAGATGPQGAKGDTGEAGLQGPKGDTGDLGPRGDTGPQGPAGTSSIVGSSLAVNDPNCPRGGSKFVVGGDTVYACNGEPGATGSQGLAGARGDTGATGPQGEQGAPGTSVVGSSVGTGDATCFYGGGRFVTGSDTTYACNGAPGATGAQGGAGPRGDTGAMGAQGPKGNTGPTGPQGADGTPCDTSAIAALQAGLGSLTATVSAQGARIATLEANACPPGWTATTESGFTGTLCTKTVAGSTDEMVKVGDYWIDRFELSNCDGMDANLGDRPAYTVTALPAGQARTTAVGCSRRGVQPQASITWFQAAQMCANAGKRLCTNAEWQTAVSGTPDPGAGTSADHGPSARVTLACNVASNPGEGPYAGTSGTAATGTPANALAHADCVSRFGAYDMIGNVWEWVADWQQAGGDASGWTEGKFAAAWSAAFGADGTWNINGRAAGDEGWKDGLPAAGFRGGDWDDGTGAGAFAVNWNNAPSSWASSYGARCCAGGK